MNLLNKKPIKKGPNNKNKTILAMFKMWKLITSKQYQILSRFWVLQSFRDTMKDFLGFGINDYKVVNNLTYINSETMDNLSKFLIAKFEEDKDYFNKIFKNWLEYCKRLKETTKTISEIDPSRLTNLELYSLLVKCIAEFKYAMAYVLVPHAVENYFEKLIRELLRKRTKNAELIKKYLITITSNIKPTILKYAQEELLRIATEIKKNNISLNKLSNYKRLNQKIIDYTTKYKWLNYDTGIGEDLTVSEVIERLKLIINKNPKKLNNQNSENEYNKLIKELRLNSFEKRIIKIAQELIFLREHRIEAMAISGSRLRPLLESIAKRVKLCYNDVIYLTPNEIKNVLLSKNINWQLINKRKQSFGFLMKNGIIRLYSGDEVSQLKEKEDIDKDVTEFKGLIANVGKAVGRVKIVLDTNDFDKVEYGDIMVSKITTPNFILAMEKCRAIVTDLGGITSHSAIVSRELGIPCITGTEFATCVLKDGDLIEVDADNGIVRKI